MSSDPPKTMRTAYSREFLISIGQSERCKHLPPGVDVSLLNELNEAASAAYNKGQYSTPLGRSDGSGGYSYSSRGGNTGGRWDTRSTGSSDREGDFPDRELLTQDRRNGNQYKRTWQNSEHDGLLGSGGFPRPSGYAGQLAPKDRGNVPQPNRTSERYQPPRPYKAGPLTRKDVDSMNDETFGSLECSNEDRAEEEKKRRASFELMRKEQHKSLQEKKSGPDTEKGNPGGDIMSMLQKSTDNLGPITNSGKPDGCVVSSVYQEDTTKTPSALPAPAARPLVPPGFSHAFVEKKVQSQSSNIALEPKAHVASREDKMSSIAQFDGQLERNQSASCRTTNALAARSRTCARPRRRPSGTWSGRWRPCRSRWRGRGCWRRCDAASTLSTGTTRTRPPWTPWGGRSACCWPRPTRSATAPCAPSWACCCRSRRPRSSLQCSGSILVSAAPATPGAPHSYS